MNLNQDKLKEYCGVFGVSCSDFTHAISGLIYSGLMSIQHRGQIFAGLSVFQEGTILTHKHKGLVSKVLNPTKLKTFSGNVGIGHVGCSAHKIEHSRDVQPYYFKSEKLHFSIAFNGSITNYAELAEKMTNMGRIFVGKSDIELIATLIEVFSRFTTDFVKVLRNLVESLEGSYAIVILCNDGNFYAVRDPVGYKPLCYGKVSHLDKSYYIVASESCALDAVGAKFVDNVQPGDILRVNPVEGFNSYSVKKLEKRGICQFEFVYFARPDSEIDGVSVAEVRYNLGRSLARNDPVRLENAIVVPVPDSGRSAAMGYAWESGLLYEEGLQKNRYMWNLKTSAEEKLNPIKTIVSGKNIILVDDSIVSGNTIKKIVTLLRNAGAKSIHVRISSPPINKNCNLNKRISVRDSLIAYDKKLMDYSNFNETMRNFIGADTLIYQTVYDLVDAIGLKENQMCISCLLDYCEILEEKPKKITLNLPLIK